MVFAALAACGPPRAPDYGGRWKPINHYARSTTGIPIDPAYVYFASPLDTTLTHLLLRWAKDSGRRLDYGVAEDFTLHQPVSRIHTTDITRAADELNRIYLPQGIRVDIEPLRIVVRSANPPSESTTSGNTGTGNNGA
ncbi:hypothetical protein EYV96_13820 [Dyella terrae]|uniref:Toxin co-regulated pilus biosynthesis protein Q C-terminal domain-containing protein n=2 Tax=Dyella TaxID=231454 RepID=A0A4R0YJT9_9GAMM|nr:hypothetical protein EYV96_13820 [Dyella terrae]TCI08699.1 hypothetical protein EZM97_25050 [Dyella soli]